MLVETGSRGSRLEVHLGHCLGRLIGRCKADEAKALASSGSLAVLLLKQRLNVGIINLRNNPLMIYIIVPYIVKAHLGSLICSQWYVVRNKPFGIIWDRLGMETIDFFLNNMLKQYRTSHLGMETGNLWMQQTFFLLNNLKQS